MRMLFSVNGLFGGFINRIFIYFVNSAEKTIGFPKIRQVEGNLGVDNPGFLIIIFSIFNFVFYG